MLISLGGTRAESVIWHDYHPLLETNGLLLTFCLFYNRTPENILAYKSCSKQCNREISLYKRNFEMKLLQNPNGKSFTTMLILG